MTCPETGLQVDLQVVVRRKGYSFNLRRSDGLYFSGYSADWTCGKPDWFEKECMLKAYRTYCKKQRFIISWLREGF